VIGALDERVGLRHYEIITQSNTGEKFSNFIQNLAIKLDGRAAMLVLDNLRVHYSKKVTEVMAKHPNLKFLYLPIYSCRLNPI
jgi:transposase